jgi:hypothetical protein
LADQIDGDFPHAMLLKQLLLDALGSSPHALSDFGIDGPAAGNGIGHSLHVIQDILRDAIRLRLVVHLHRNSKEADRL